MFVPFSLFKRRPPSSGTKRRERRARQAPQPRLRFLPACFNTFPMTNVIILIMVFVFLILGHRVSAFSPPKEIHPELGPTNGWQEPPDPGVNLDSLNQELVCAVMPAMEMIALGTVVHHFVTKRKKETTYQAT
ncbi:MAG: hypothetical protein ACREOZ_01470, partial [Gloeomargaritales cyanobacterium]